jgi:hypothetical protein
MTRTHIVPPQVTQISLQLKGRKGKPVALSVDELVKELGKKGAA